MVNKMRKNPTLITCHLLFKSLVLVVFAGAAMGCAAPSTQSPIKPPGGILFTQVKYPLTTKFKNKETHGGKPLGSRIKTSMIWDLIFTSASIGWGEAEIASVAKESKASQIDYVEVQSRIILGIYYEQELFVYGK
jgi:hypothetical protein